VVSERIGKGMAKATLRTHLESAAPTRTGQACKTCTYIESLSPDDAAALQEYLKSEVSSRLISDALTSYGMRISQSAVSRHRRECAPLD